MEKYFFNNNVMMEIKMMEMAVLPHA